MAEAKTDRIARQFCDRTLPENEWSHEAHLRVGLWHLLRYPPGYALCRLRDRIRRYNTACGIANTDSSGYHETITQFFVMIIADFLARQDTPQDVDRLAESLLESLGDKRLPFSYYTKDRLMSKAARRHWMEPDLQPLPSVDVNY